MRQLLLVLAFGVGNVLSQSGDSKPGDKTGTDANTAYKNSPLTIPLTIEIKPIITQQPSPKPYDCCGTHAQEELQAAKDTASYTGLLVAVGGATALVLLVQSILIGLQIKATRNEFISTHHPRITLRDATASKNWGQPIVVRYTLANAGGTRARIVESKFSVQVDAVEGMKLLPDCARTNQIGDRFIEAGTHYSSNVESADKWPDVPVDNPWSFEGTKNIFFSGHIVYTDDRKIRRHTAFYRSYDPIAGRFYTSAAKIMEPLNYED